MVAALKAEQAKTPKARREKATEEKKRLAQLQDEVSESWVYEKRATADSLNSELGEAQRLREETENMTEEIKKIHSDSAVAANATKKATVDEVSPTLDVVATKLFKVPEELDTFLPKGEHGLPLESKCLPLPCMSGLL